MKKFLCILALSLSFVAVNHAAEIPPLPSVDIEYVVTDDVAVTTDMVISIDAVSTDVATVDCVFVKDAEIDDQIQIESPYSSYDFKLEVDLDQGLLSRGSGISVYLLPNSNYKHVNGYINHYFTTHNRYVPVINLE